MDAKNILEEKILLFKQAGLTNEELSYVKIISESLDGMFLELQNKLNITIDVVTNMFTIFFSAEFPKIIKKREYEFSLMQEDKNDIAISATIGKCYGDLMINFCEKNESYGIEHARNFKNAIIELMPVLYKIEKESPLTIYSLFNLSISLNKKLNKDV